MKKILLSVFVILTAINVINAQDDDTTHYLFRSLKVSYLQYTFGYERVALQYEKGGLNAFHATYLGFVLNEKLALSLSLDVANHPYATFNPGEHYPKTSGYVGTAFEVEPLIRPKKLINFSIPLSIGFANVTQWDTVIDFAHPWSAAYSSTALGYQVNEYNNSFVYFAGGMNGFINLWKPLSLGAGVRYRYSIDVTNSIRQPDISGLDWNIFLRWKWDFKAYNKKMMERQREWMQNTQH